MYKRLDACFEDVAAVTNRHLCRGSLEQQIDRICRYHPQAIILREKDLPEEEYEKLAGRIIAICEKHKIQCILHVYLDAAKRLNHRAIHLPMPLLRRCHGSLHSFSLIGTSVHSVEEALEAEQYGVNYMAAGHIYATDCKKGAKPKGIGFLSQVCQSVNVPVYAIGGINLDRKRMKEIKSAGARGGFVMSAMMQL